MNTAIFSGCGHSEVYANSPKIMYEDIFPIVEPISTTTENGRIVPIVTTAEQVLEMVTKNGFNPQFVMDFTTQVLAPMRQGGLEKSRKYPPNTYSMVEGHWFPVAQIAVDMVKSCQELGLSDQHEAPDLNRVFEIALTHDILENAMPKEGDKREPGMLKGVYHVYESFLREYGILPAVKSLTRQGYTDSFIEQGSEAVPLIDQRGARRKPNRYTRSILKGGSEVVVVKMADMLHNALWDLYFERDLNDLQAVRSLRKNRALINDIIVADQPRGARVVEILQMYGFPFNLSNRRGSTTFPREC